MIKLGLAERRNLLRFAVAGVLILGGGAALGWRAGQTADPVAGPTAKEQLALTAPKEENVTKDLGALTSLHPWSGFVEQQKPARPPPPARPTWRLAGIVQRGDETYALITTSQGPAAKFEYRRVGETLPDGSILVQITADSAKTQMSRPSDSSSSSAATSSDSSAAASPDSSSPPAAASSDSSAPSAAAPPASPPDARTYRLFDKKH
jgi:hypothetical protein